MDGAPRRIPKSTVVTAPLPGGARVAGRVASLAAAAFVVILATLHVIEPEFDPSWHFISEYQLGAWGWLMSLGFYCLAISAGALLIAVRSQIRTVGGYIGLILLGVVTIAFALAGTFTTDPITATTATSHGMVHNLGAVMGSNVAGAAYFLGWSLARNVAWRGARVALLWITAVAVAGNLASFAQTAIIASGAGQFGPNVAVGWPNRVLIVAFAAWMLALSGLLTRMPSAAEEIERSVGGGTPSTASAMQK